MLTTIPRAWLRPRKSLSLICTYLSEGGSGKPPEVVSVGGSCFSQGTASSITLSRTPATVEAGKGCDSLTAPAMTSHKAMVLFLRRGVEYAKLWV